MKKLNNTIKLYAVVAITAMFFITSCNKGLEQLEPIVPAPYTGSIGTMAKTIALSPSDSLYNKLIVKAGLVNLLNDSTKNFTMFITDNNGMKIAINRLSGGLVPLNAPDAVFAGFINANISATAAAGIVSYNTIGQKFKTANFLAGFPNYPLPTLIQLDPVNTPFLRMTICPFRASGAYPFYLNNIPITVPDQEVTNGVLHRTLTLVAPPSRLLKDTIARDTALVYFRAAIARGDVGSVGLSRLDSLMGYGPLNMTILPPNNAAMRTVLSGVIYQGAYQTIYNLIYNGNIAGGATVAQATAAATAQAPGQTLAFATAKSSVDSLSSPTAGFNLVPVVNARGIVAYHFLATDTGSKCSPNIRVFSVNVPTSPTFVRTLVNGSAGQHPGVMSVATFAGPFTSSVKFTGLGTFPSGGAFFSSPASNVISADNHAVNGIYHVIDRVLLPQ
jgi:hypothetical protein